MFKSIYILARRHSTIYASHYHDDIAINSTIYYIWNYRIHGKTYINYISTIYYIWNYRSHGKTYINYIF